LLQKYFLKLPHYSCKKNQLYFLNKKLCILSDKAAFMYKNMPYELNYLKKYSEEVVEELLQTQSIITCNISNEYNLERPLIVVISPHLDDAVFSIGGLLTRLSMHYRIHIITLFSIDPYSIYKDLRKDFERLQQLRLKEEMASMSLIRATTLQMGWKDAMLRGYKNIYEPINPEEPLEWYINSIRDKIPESPHLILCPLGITHVDHRLTRILVDRVNVTKVGLKTPIIYYEDLPYACDGFKQKKSYKSCCFKLNDFEVNNKKKMAKIYISQLAPGLITKILNHRKGQECLWYRDDNCTIDWKCNLGSSIFSG